MTEYIKEHYFIILEMAKKELTPEQYEELIFEPIQTLNEQEKACKKMIYNLTLSRILKGAAYIESITPEHPKYQVANDRYDYLVKSLEEIT